MKTSAYVAQKKLKCAVNRGNRTQDHITEKTTKDKLCDQPHNLSSVHAGIEWSRGYESLDKELQRITRDARIGRRQADKLFKVWRTDGDEAWLFIHVEVQGKRERALAERMFV